jgi:competence protein ComGC
MKNKKSLMIVAFIVAAFFLLLFLLAFHAARKYAQEMNLTQNIKKLDLALETYSAYHGKYPISLEELFAQSDVKTQNSLKQILHDSQNHNYEYQPRTNGFMVDISSPDKKDRYSVEFVESTNHSLLTINGATALENWSK